MSVFTRAVLAATHNRLVRGLVTSTPPGRSLAHRFVAGDDVEAAVAAVHVLNEAGMVVSLDLLGEEVHDRETAVSATDGYLECIDHIAADGVQGNISIKLSQLGLAFDTGLAAEALDRLAERAATADTTVTIDMEDSRFTEATIDLYATAQRRHQNLGVCVQAYLRRTPADLERIIPLGGHVRLCKGAYVEPADVAFQTREEVEDAYLGLLDTLMGAEGVRPAIATHDDRLITRARQLARHRQNPFEFQMLFGVRPALQESLVAEGMPVRVYVPYGSEWYAYLTRRLAERPSNSLFFLRALVGSG